MASYCSGTKAKILSMPVSFLQLYLILCSLLSSTLAFFWLLCNAMLPPAIMTLDMPLPLPETHPPAVSSVFPSLLLQSLLMSVKNLSNQTKSAYYVVNEVHLLNVMYHFTFIPNACPVLFQSSN